MGSPLQYGYRTKLTPHFQVPPKKVVAKIDKGDPEVQPDWLKIGFNKKGINQIIDIEECPIATPLINERLPGLREEVIQYVELSCSIKMFG
jgi:tRNA (uracil-5-)-methyltransferase